MARRRETALQASQTQGQSPSPQSEEDCIDQALYKVHQCNIHPSKDPLSLEEGSLRHRICRSLWVCSLLPAPVAPSAATSQNIVQTTLLNNPPAAVKELPFRLFIAAGLIAAALLGYYLRGEGPED
ncbi:hypothetical protein WJX73_003680 [Symbiochloris irregularis]|uniref:Uncharacterized protein n=1 Tax=Symbiochloris irregularis TaxID=706552 RepID=A0AAW1P1C5_9CHLO